MLIALFLTALLGLGGLAIDIGVARQQRLHAQAAADAAAMSAASDLPGSRQTALSDATSEATANGFSATGGTTVTVNIPPSSGPHSGNSNAVEVLISKQVPTAFLPLFGKSSITATARAVAVASGTGAPCALCILSPSASGAMIMNGGGNINVTGAGIAVDSSSSTALIVNGRPSLTATSISVVGNYTNNSNGPISPTPQTHAPVVPDPLSGVPVPSLTGTAKQEILNGTDSGTISPGIYSMIEMNGTGNLTLNPGVYVLTGPFIMNGSGNVYGSGVTIYFTCSAYPTPCTSGQSGGYLVMNGNGSYTPTAPTSGSYQGMGIFYDRNNTATLTMNGSGTNNYTGTIYAKSSQLIFNGNTATTQINSLVVVNTMIQNGSGNLNLSFTASQNYPVSAPPGSSSLVE